MQFDKHYPDDGEEFYNMDEYLYPENGDTCWDMP